LPVTFLNGEKKKARGPEWFPKPLGGIGKTNDNQDKQPEKNQKTAKKEQLLAKEKLKKRKKGESATKKTISVQPC